MNVVRYRQVTRCERELSFEDYAWNVLIVIGEDAVQGVVPQLLRIFAKRVVALASETPYGALQPLSLRCVLLGIHRQPRMEEQRQRMKKALEEW